MNSPKLASKAASKVASVRVPAVINIITLRRISGNEPQFDLKGLIGPRKPWLASARQTPRRNVQPQNGWAKRRTVVIAAMRGDVSWLADIAQKRRYHTGRVQNPASNHITRTLAHLCATPLTDRPHGLCPSQAGPLLNTVR